VPIPGVKITPPSRALQAKIGGSAAALLPEAAQNLIEKRLTALNPFLLRDIGERLDKINRLSRIRNEGVGPQIFAEAHQIRSMAGTAGRPKLGHTASVLCAYLEGVDDDFKPDANFLTLVAVAAAQIKDVENQADPMVAELVQDCAEAAAVTMAKEGRAPRAR
jgi:hypothetical protein